jgi:prophage endopeptidase
VVADAVDHVECAVVLVARWLIACAMCVAGGFTAGYAWEHRARLAEVSQIRADIARREAAAAEESRRRIEAAQKAADQAIAARDARIADLDAITRRLRHDLKTATTGRPCLSADARSVLHQSPAFGLKLPSTSGGPASADAAPAADPGEPASETSDTDIAGWILDAAALYEACRARIDALRQWDEVTHGR